MNEEEIRGKLLLPFLNDLGFNPAEIALETGFAIRLGKSRHIMKGRSDILCRRNGKNLFIIELKNDDISVTQNDIDQGISYARALDDIAPFTIITNGKTTKIFDSVTKAELTGKKIAEVSDFWKNGCTLATDVELKIRYEALKKFVSFSDENLLEFCKSQVQDRMGTIVGSIDSPGAKFVKELYVKRGDLQQVFKNFVDSDASVFGIVGSAGVGKTSAMCSLALQSLDHDFVFFYNAAIINRSPLEHIAQDLNGVFSAKSESDLILKKLDELGRSLDKKILLFIDAIDESLNTAIAIELSEIALAIRNLDHVKLCISCKDNFWPSVLAVNDTRTHLYEELNRFGLKIPKLDNNPGYFLNDFSEVELREIIPIYRNAFGFKGTISEELLKELKNGFFLRIFSEVYCKKEVPIRVDDKYLISAYLKQSLGKTTIGIQPSLRILGEIGRILMNYTYSDQEAFKDDGVEVEKLLDSLNFSLDKGLPEDLFARNILARANKSDSYNISFYYSKIRDHIICFHSYKLDQLDDNQFAELVQSFYENYIGQSAIAYYIENASENHKYILIEFKKAKALAYVNKYNSYLADNFQKFKKLFRPETNGDIGIVLPPNLLKNDGFALFPITAGLAEKIIYENLQNAFTGNYFESRLYQIGVHAVNGSHLSLLGSDQDEVVRKNIFGQLKDIVEKGRLNAWKSDILLREQVALIVYYYAKQLFFDYKIKDFYLPQFDQIYPIDLNDLQIRIQKFRALHYYERSNFPRHAINALVEEALVNKTEMPPVHIMGDFPPMEHLSKIVALLQERGHDLIQNHHLPSPDVPIAEARQVMPSNYTNEIGHMRRYQFSRPQAILYIESFFSCFEQCYKEFVEECFPTFKEEFSFYKGMPYEYFFYMDNSDVLKWGSFGFSSSKDGKRKFHFKEHVHFEIAFKEDHITSMRGFSLDSILHSDHHRRVKTVDRVNTGKVDDFAVLRDWVFRFLREDMRKFFRANGSAI